jgi:hypothetical protein
MCIFPHCIDFARCKRDTLAITAGGPISPERERESVARRQGGSRAGATPLRQIPLCQQPFSLYVMPSSSNYFIFARLELLLGIPQHNFLAPEEVMHALIFPSCLMPAVRECLRNMLAGLDRWRARLFQRRGYAQTMGTFFQALFDLLATGVLPSRVSLTPGHKAILIWFDLEI